MDDIYRKWFQTDTVKVKVALENAGDFLGEQEITDLTGAPGGSSILVRQVRNAIQFQVSNKIFAEDMYRYLVADVGGTSYYLTNAVLVFREAFTNMGIGPRCVVKEIHTARLLRKELPIRCIKVDAIGNHASFHWASNPMRGYYVWPCMGFDGAIPDAVRIKLSEKYREKRYLSELMRDQQARREWLLHGESVKLDFDLAPGSRSWELLSHYMREKGIEL